MATPFLGIRGTGDWTTNEKPQDWAEFIMYEYPNGSAPLYAMQSMIAKDSVSSHTYTWWTETLPTRAGTVSSIYIDSALGTEYVYATHQSTLGIAGGVVYAKVAEALVEEFVPHDRVLLRDSDQLEVDVIAHVTNVVKNGANSYLALELAEADDNHADSTTYNLATVDYVLKIDSAHPEFSDAPRPMTYKPVEYSNNAQIFRNTFAISESAKAEEIRTGDPYKQDKKRCVDRHSMDIEFSGWFGQKRTTTGLNGKPLYMTQGLIPFMRENNPSNYANFYNSTDTAYSSKTWLQAGKKFLNTNLKTIFRYLKGEAMIWCGDGALEGLNELAEYYGTINMKTADKAYGIAVNEWHTAHGRTYWKTHPLWSRDSTMTNMVVVGLPANARFCPKVANGINRNTMFQKDMQIPGQDGTLDGFLTEGGWKFFFPNQWFIMNGVGLDNAN